MTVLQQVNPQAVFQYFEELCAIPHGSGDTKRISDYCVCFAKEHHLDYVQDDQNNVILFKAATAGYEQAEPMILQGHLDMVCEKEADCPIDFQKDGLELQLSGDRIWAKGTTLGGDDGIAIAMALAVLASSELAHPRLEALFTVDEEIGMLGAAALDVAPLKGRKLLNIDSEKEGVLSVSCAGGVRNDCILPVERENLSKLCYTITVDGLAGGHSGVEIHKGRANSNVLMARVLYGLRKKMKFRLLHLQGGLKDNAIPLKTVAVVALDADCTAAAEELVAAYDRAFRAEYQTADPAVRVRGEAGELAPCSALTQKSTDKVLRVLLTAPNGVQEMSMDIPGLVQTSLNLGILKLEEDTLRMTFIIRSAVATQKEMLVNRLQALMEQIGGNVEVAGDYPGWAYQKDSALRELLIEIYREQYGHAPVVEATHAGMECGLLAGKIPGLDCISFGPDLMDIHTARESISVSSVARVWDFLTEILKRSK